MARPESVKSNCKDSSMGALVVILIFLSGRVPLARRARNLLLIDSGRGSARAEDAGGIPTQSHISPSILLYTKINQFEKVSLWEQGGEGYAAELEREQIGRSPPSGDITPCRMTGVTV